MSADSDPGPGQAPQARGAVEVAGLSWRPFGRRAPVLRELTLSIPPGQRVLLVGPSGAGKSTLLRGIGGLLETADAGERSGSVTIDGVPAGSRAGHVGMVLQEPGAGLVAATIERDAAFGLENVGAPREAMPGVVEQVLRAVHLDLPGNTPTSSLSGGQTQRLAIAGALALSPAVLLLDEPTAMLDPDSAAAVRDCVADIAARCALTTVIVEHRLGPWVPLVDRLIALAADGSIVADGEPAAVLAEHGTMLADQGVWVPGIAPPTPLTVALPAVDVGRALAVDPAAADLTAAADPAAADPTAAADPATAAPTAAVAADSGPAEPPSAAPVWADQVSLERVTWRPDGTARRSVALSGASVRGRAARTTALVGPSGSGKSSLLLVLAGLLEPTGGSATPTEVPTSQARRLAWVPQWSSSTIVAHTVLDEVLVTSRALGIANDLSEPRARALLESLGLQALAGADPRHLSGGEQRRLALAAALVHGPRALLADEPTVGQDRRTWAAIMGILNGFRDAGGAVVVATHDSDVIAAADEVVVLRAPVVPPERGPVRRPLLSRAGPLSLLAGGLFGVLAGVLSPHWRWSLLIFAVQLALGLIGLVAPGSGRVSVGRVRRVTVGMIPGALGALSIGWSTWLLGGADLDLALTGIMRVLLIITPSAFLVAFIDTDSLGDHLAQRLRLPARPVVAFSSAMQRVHSFGDTWREISRSRRVRGLGMGRRPSAVARSLWALTFGLLVRSLRQAADLAVAMDARGFASAQRRTWAAPARWRLADTVVLVGALVPVLLALMPGVLGWKIS